MLCVARQWLRLPLAACRIAGGGWFDRPWYRERLPRDACWCARLFPLSHYLLRGGFAGRDPSPAFDSDWYRSQYPDVVASGLNPLVHYVLYGRVEGRSPRLGAAVHLPEEPVALDERSRWYFKLWGGFEHEVLPVLRHCSARGQTTADWLLAEWDYAHGRIEAARDRLLRLAERRGPDRRLLVGLVKCYGALKNHEAVRALLARPGVLETLGNDGLFAPLNADPDPARRADNVRRLGDVEAPPGLISHASPEPLISVIIPAYNAASTLQTALDSLLAQTWPHLDILVVDDASDDDTLAVGQAYARRDKRVRCLRNARNLGAYPTRNHGMRAAQGDFVTVHDADDWSHPERLERQLVPLLENPELVATGSRWVRVTEDHRCVGSWMLGEPFLEPNHSAWLIRRAALERVGLWDAVKVAADTEFLTRLEHHYGHRALQLVCPARPLSLALSDASSLTQARATHVRTVFYGLRRIYRESAQWWHRASDRRPVMGEAHPFPLPLGNLKQPPRRFDCVLAANLAQPAEALAEVLHWLEATVAAGRRPLLFHWPDYRAWHGNAIADAVFALAQRHGVYFAHAGIAVEAPELVLAQPSLWTHPPTTVVRVEGLQEVTLLDGAECPDAEPLRAYFQSGGQPCD